MNMKLRSGFEYTFVEPYASSARASLRSRRRLVKWRQFVKSHRRTIVEGLGLWSFANKQDSSVARILQELTRFKIKSKLSSKADWTREWATKSLARRFVPASAGSSHTKPERPAQVPFQEGVPFDVSFRTVPLSFAWKNPLTYSSRLLRESSCSDPEHVFMLRELFRKRGEIFPSWVPMGQEFALEEWEMVYRTPSGSLDARFVLSKPKPCTFPCFCRLHLASSSVCAVCITCENYSFLIRERGPSHFWSRDFVGFNSHVASCRSRRARRYRGRYGCTYGKSEPGEDGFYY